MKISHLNFSKSNSLLLIVILIFFVACNTQKKEPAPEMDDESKDIVERPGDIISLDEADSLFVNYSRRRADAIIKMESMEDGEAFKPVRFVSFDLETVKKYIAFVEQEAIKGGTKVDSLRVYLGNYGVEAKGPNNRHNTLFILPSAKAEGSYGGIYIGDDGSAKLISNYFHKNEGGENGQGKSKASFVPNWNSSLMQGGGSLILNYGNCCPPKNGDF